MTRLAKVAARNVSVIRFAERFHNFEHLDNWTRQHYMYREENEEIVRSPEWMLRDLSELGYLEGDCDDIATFTACVCKIRHCVVRLVAIRVAQPYFEHVFTEAHDGQRWYRFDPTVEAETIHWETERMVQYV